MKKIILLISVIYSHPKNEIFRCDMESKSWTSKWWNIKVHEYSDQQNYLEVPGTGIYIGRVCQSFHRSFTRGRSLCKSENSMEPRITLIVKTGQALDKYKLLTKRLIEDN
jgi:hypothetical protein